ncbi:MAG: AAA family ATPase, partial [Candidatus Desulforudis sp.]|nr:AAA family ATPase [Desulforudis sp.]
MTNQEFLKSLESPKAQFYLCDFHVHSPASYDIRTGKRFAALSSLEREKIEQIPEEMAGQLEDYEYKALELFPVHLYYDLLLKRRNQLAEQWGLSPGEDWAFMAITDHNVCRYSHLLAKHAWTKRNENRFIVFPGIELTVRFDVSKDLPTVAHILCVFEPLTDRSSIRIAICDASGTPEWSPGLPELKVESLPDFVNKIRSHDLYPAICISAHVGSSKGVQYASTRCILNNLDAEIIRTQSSLDLNPDQDARQAREHIERLKRRRSPDAVSLEVLELIGQCGFDALQIAEEQDKVHYNSLHRFRPDFGRSVPILCSDAHRVEDVFNCSGAVSFLKLSRVSSTIDRRVLFHDVRDKALKYGETRYSYTYPGKVSEWIEGIRITPNATTPSRFWPFRSDSPFVLSFSRNLNCLIGGRGSGKSALIEALAYGLNTEEPNELDPKNIDAQDWYKRAKATLNGCQVDVCYKSTSGALGDLPKKVIFSGRYFREPIRERAVRYSNKDDTELFSQNIEVPRVQILRIHEIEKAAEPDKLRELFDSFCGNQIKVLEKQISDTKQQLVDQRRRIVRVVEQLVELVEDGSPLSDYVNRFRRYNEVNHPDMQVKYQNVDNAYEAEKIAREAIQTWNEIDYNSLK